MGVGNIHVVGISADGPDPEVVGWIRDAALVVGSPRLLDLVRPHVRAHSAGGRGARLRALPTPLRPGLRDLLVHHAQEPVVVLASGDPLVSGIGALVVEIASELGRHVHIHPAVSSVALARARMGWSADTVTVLRLGAVDQVRRHISPGNRLIVLSADETSPAAIAAALTDCGAGDSILTVLGDLGADTESRTRRVARELAGQPADHPRLNLVCVEVRGSSPAGVLTPGLPDDAFDHDGQITKRHIRAAALAALAPHPGDRLWDLGAGAGSIGVEWARCHRSLRVDAVEQHPGRAARIRANADRLGVPTQITVHTGAVATHLATLAPPQAIFLGGGITPDILDACRDRLTPGGRLVAHAVTFETETALLDAQARHGGDLVSLHVQAAQPLGGFRAWQPSRPIIQWALTKET